MMKTAFFFISLLIANLGSAQYEIESLYTEDQVIDLYKKLYQTSALKSMPWNGSVSGCNSGTLPNDIYIKAQNRINFRRLVNGLAEIKVNPGFNPMAQDAALLFGGEGLPRYAH